MTSVRERIEAARETLVRAGLQPEDAAIDAAVLARHVLGWDQATLLTHSRETPPAAFVPAFNACVARRAAREPVAMITGVREFWGLDFEVTPDVLVPRPETELLVEWALALMPLRGEGLHVLDLGTGSGAIALAVKAERPDVAVTATDASADALAVAQANAERLELAVDFHLGSSLDAVPGQRFDVIASNPPYIAEGDPHLRALEHEPINALTAGADGLDDLRTIIARAHHALHPGGWLLLEHGHDQAPAVRDLLEQHGFEAVGSRTDLAGIERCSGARWPQQR